MDGVRGSAQTPGDFRTTQNWIGAPGCTLETARFVPPPVDAMHDALADLERFLHERQMPTLVALALAHYQFEAIHPFPDGNGRLGRLLVPLVLAERRELPMPMLYLSAYFDRHQEEYYEHLFNVSATGGLESWIRFFLRGVAEQSQDALRRTHRLVDLQASLRGKLMSERYPVTTLRLAEALLGQPYITSTSTMGLLGSTRPTANAAINNLLKLGVLEEITGRKRDRIYFSPDVFKIVYGDPAGGRSDLWDSDQHEQ